MSPSNVAKLILALAPTGDDGIAQLPLYHKGVGTGRWERLRGGAYGRGLGGHVREVYRSIAEEYEPGDEIFLFGFSRGAFTVRSAAGLIFNSGILRKQNLGKLDDAYRLYRRRDSKSRPNGIEARLFRKQYSHPEPEVAGGPKQIKCIGVWDTVGALGIPAAIPWLPAKLSVFRCQSAVGIPQHHVQHPGGVCVPGAGHRRAPPPIHAHAVGEEQENGAAPDHEADVVLRRAHEHRRRLQRQRAVRSVVRLDERKAKNPGSPSTRPCSTHPPVPMPSANCVIRGRGSTSFSAQRPARSDARPMPLRMIPRSSSSLMKMSTPARSNGRSRAKIPVMSPENLSPSSTNVGAAEARVRQPAGRPGRSPLG